MLMRSANALTAHLELLLAESSIKILLRFNSKFLVSEREKAYILEGPKEGWILSLYVPQSMPRPKFGILNDLSRIANSLEHIKIKKRKKSESVKIIISKKRGRERKARNTHVGVKSFDPETIGEDSKGFEKRCKSIAEVC